MRASQRDADTHTAFEPLRYGARHLLATAETQLALLPENTVQSRWVYQLGVLHAALDRLDGTSSGSRPETLSPPPPSPAPPTSMTPSPSITPNRGATSMTGPPTARRSGRSTPLLAEPVHP
ncbi:hypothetical protein QA943_07030 [Streptomyces sp. B21-097]|uniref:hypothetical protein n=1 Tax=Streptomyces sp. B21-097 TaxID=3039414 RepID=UPI002FF112C6